MTQLAASDSIDVPRLQAVYDHNAVTLYCGDIHHAWDSLPNDIACVVTDPPYIAHGYIRELEETEMLDVALDIRWQSFMFEWIGEWWYPLRGHMRDDACAWVFTSTHHVGFYLRWARMTKLPLRGIFQCPPDEFLLAFGPKELTPEEGVDIARQCRKNTYGQNKPVELLRTLIEYSPHGTVLDPFCGQGSALLAARAEARAAIGVEIRPEYCDSAILKLT